MTEIVSAIIIMVGVIFVVIGAIGIIRLPDFYIRVSAITKAATVGVACIMIGVALTYNEVGMAIKAFAVVLFLLITSPIASHIIGRAAYNDGVPLWKKTVVDELEEYKKDKEIENSPKDPKPKNNIE
jgi:multicomponent Na+:H+ antiporter subunit G